MDKKKVLDLFSLGKRGIYKAKRRKAKEIARYLQSGKDDNEVKIIQTLQSPRDGMTMIQVEWISGRGTPVQGVGGSKRNMNDKWDAELGKTIAYNRAVFDLACNVMYLLEKEFNENYLPGAKDSLGKIIETIEKARKSNIAKSFEKGKGINIIKELVRDQKETDIHWGKEADDLPQAIRDILAHGPSH